MLKILKFYLRDQKAATVVEYALIGAAVGLTVAALIFSLGDQIGDTFSTLGTAVGEVEVPD